MSDDELSKLAEKCFESIFTEDPIGHLVKYFRTVRNSEAPCYCGYCHKTFTVGEVGWAELQEHIQACEKRPIVKLKKEITELKERQNLSLPSEEEFRDWSNSRKRMPFELKLSDQRGLARAARLEAYNWLRANFKKQAPISDEEIWKYLTAVEPVLGPAYKAAAYLAWRAAEKHHGISE